MEYDYIAYDDLTIKQFSWREDESVRYNELYRIVNSYGFNLNNVYLFGSFNYNYPIPFRAKHFGLWKTAQKKYELKINSSAEKNFDFNSHGVIYGFSEVEYNEHVIEFLLNFRCNSCLIITNRNYDVRFLTDNFIQKSNWSKDTIYTKLIDYFCSNGVVAFVVDGSGETALYICPGNTGDG